MSSILGKHNLVNILLNASVVCAECGTKYGKYSVGCSSRWNGICDVCDMETAVTEVRDYGYLQKGIDETRAAIKEQSKEVAAYMASVGPIMSDEELTQHMEESENKVTYKTSIVGVCVHKVDADHRTLQTEVRLVDEGGGEYISLTDSEGQEIRLDFEEFEEVVKAVALLRAQ